MMPMPPRRTGSHAPSSQREDDSHLQSALLVPDGLPVRHRPVAMGLAALTAIGAAAICVRAETLESARAGLQCQSAGQYGLRGCAGDRRDHGLGAGRLPPDRGRPGRHRGFVGGKNLAGRGLKQTTRPSGAALTVNQTLFNDVQIGNSSRRAESNVLSQCETLRVTELPRCSTGPGLFDQVKELWTACDRRMAAEEQSKVMQAKVERLVSDAGVEICSDRAPFSARREC